MNNIKMLWLNCYDGQLLASCLHACYCCDMTAVSLFVPGVLTLGKSKPTLADLSDLTSLKSPATRTCLLGWWTSCLQKR